MSAESTTPDQARRGGSVRLLWHPGRREYRRSRPHGKGQPLLRHDRRGESVRRLLRVGREAGGHRTRHRVLRLTKIGDTIVHRRSTMILEGAVPLLKRSTAHEYASWFKALADPTRVQLVELLARTRAPMSVGEIVTAMGLAQSTVSQHLKILTEVRFVLVESVGNARHYRINHTCISCFPSAADVVMGKPAPTPPNGR